MEIQSPQHKIGETVFEVVENPVGYCDFTYRSSRTEENKSKSNYDFHKLPTGSTLVNVDY